MIEAGDCVGIELRDDEKILWVKRYRRSWWRRLLRRSARWEKVDPTSQLGIEILRVLRVEVQ